MTEGQGKINIAPLFQSGAIKNTGNELASSEPVVIFLYDLYMFV